MKKIADEVSLKGKIETISMMDLRHNPGDVFQAVELGKVFIIEKKGEPIAVISRPPGETLTIHVNGKGKITYIIPN